MLKSMTGFGRSKYENEGREYLVEIKSVNNRYNDISIKLPRNISFLEEKVKTAISNSISRGKVDVFINFINNSEKGKKIKNLLKKFFQYDSIILIIKSKIRKSVLWMMLK